MINICLKNNVEYYYERNEYTKYSYIGRWFIITKNKYWIGIYDMNKIKYISVHLSKGIDY